MLRQRGELVNYDTGTQLIVDVKVIITRPAANQIDIVSDGVISAPAKQWDVLIDPDTILDSNGIRIQPAVGHKILRSNGMLLAVEHRQAEDNTSWRWSDSLETWRRVFCQEL